MKQQILTIFIISSLLSIGAIGSFELGFINHTGQYVCPLSSLSAGECSTGIGNMAIALHHISGIRNLTQPIMSSANSLLLLSIILFSASVIIYKILSRAPELQLLYYKIRDKIRKPSHKSRKKMLRWFALRYSRNPKLLQRMYVVA